MLNAMKLIIHPTIVNAMNAASGVGTLQIARIAPSPSTAAMAIQKKM